MANKQITTQDLDFDKIKSNLKTFFQGQTDLTDYNFEGSGLSLLLDLLAYNTHYNNLYLNLAVNESFLDSAVIRNSVVSKAAELGYLPRSASSAKSIVDITLTNVPNNPSIYAIPSLTAFIAAVNGTNFTFYNIAPSVASNINGVYKFNNLVITEGTPLTQTYVVGVDTEYKISNADCDIDTISVDVYESLNSTIKTKFNKVTDIISVKADDPVFFIKEIDGLKYQIQFGNGRIGKAVSPGNVVVINYFASNKALANGAKLFSSPSLGANASIVTLYTSTGGAEAETIDDIKFNAPRLFNATNRAVTSEDYKSLLTAKFANIDSVNVWGGDDNVPPVYGKVFISIAPRDSAVLTDTEKTIIKNDILKSRKTVTVVPEFVDPYYLNIRLNSTVYFNSDSTTKTKDEIAISATNAILEYGNANLKKFDSVFRYSKLMNAIDSSDVSITSNISILVVDRDVPVKYNINANYIFGINNPVYSAGVPEDAVTSNGFYVLGDNTNIHYLIDDGYGIIMRYYIHPSTLQKVYTNVKQGSIDYALGKLTISNLNITRLANPEFTVTFKLQSNDVLSVRDHIVRINPNTLTVTAIPESGNSGLTHIFTPSR